MILKPGDYGFLISNILFKEEENTMEQVALKFIGAGLMAFGMLGAAIGVGNIFSSLLNASCT